MDSQTTKLIVADVFNVNNCQHKHILCYVLSTREEINDAYHMFDGKNDFNRIKITGLTSLDDLDRWVTESFECGNGTTNIAFTFPSCVDKIIDYFIQHYTNENTIGVFKRTIGEYQQRLYDYTTDDMVESGTVIVAFAENT